MLKTAAEVIATGDVRLIVDFGNELDRSIKASIRQLEEVKKYLRDEAKRQGGKPTFPVFLQGNLGGVSVSFPPLEPRAKKGVDLLAAEAGIPPEVYSALFRKHTVVEFAADFLQRMPELPRSAFTMISNIVEVKESTARVTFGK